MLENQVEDVNSSSGNSIVKLKPGFYFYDYNAKLTFSKSEQEKMSISVYGGKDFLASTGAGKHQTNLFRTPVPMQTGAITDSVIRGSSNGEEGFFSNLEVGYSGYQNQYTEQTEVTTRKGKNTTITLFDTYEENKLNDFSASLKNEFALGLKNTVDFGIQTKYKRIYLPKRTPEPTPITLTLPIRRGSIQHFCS